MTSNRNVKKRKVEKNGKNELITDKWIQTSLPNKIASNVVGKREEKKEKMRVKNTRLQNIAMQSYLRRIRGLNISGSFNFYILV